MHFYNEFAGRSVERLAAISDGVFAFAMTLLMLDLHVPEFHFLHGVPTEADLGRSLLGLVPNVIPWVMSFMTLGIFWIGQQTQLNKLDHADRDLTWLHLAFLLAMTLLPFSTKLLAAFITFRTALIVYWLNGLAGGIGLYCTWRYARRAGLIKPDMPADLDSAIYRRIVIAQSLYAFGALLCVFGTYWSIAWIFLAQLNYVIAPRFGFLREFSVPCKHNPVISRPYRGHAAALR